MGELVEIVQRAKIKQNKYIYIYIYLSCPYSDKNLAKFQ